MALDFSNRNDLQDNGYKQHRISHLFWVSWKGMRAIGAKNASGSLGALVAYEQQRRVG